MPKQQLDSLDLSILTMLSDNARKPYLEISRECGVSGAAVHQRIQRLTSNGVILRSQCVIDPSALGYDTCAFVGIILNSPEQHEAIVEHFSEIPEVVECYYTSGRYDLLIKVYARNNQHLLQLLLDLQKLGGTRTETIVSFRQVFERQSPVLQAIKEVSR